MQWVQHIASLVRLSNMSITPSQGDILLISRGTPTEDSLEGVVIDYSSRWLRVALPTPAASAIRGAGPNARWRLDLFANTASHERSMAALAVFGAMGGGGGGEAVEVEGGEGWPDLWRLLAGAVAPGERLHCFGCGNTGARAEWLLACLHSWCKHDRLRANTALSECDEASYWSTSSPAMASAPPAAAVKRPMQPNTLTCAAVYASTHAGTTLEAAAAVAPPWLRGKHGRERLTAGRKALRATTVNPKPSTQTQTTANPAHGHTSSRQKTQSPEASTSSVAGTGATGVAQAVSLPPLNPSQVSAAEVTLSRTLTLWQGPPGTGKTQTLLRFTLAALAALPAGRQLLVSAASNVSWHC